MMKTLKEIPLKREETTTLIEQSFNYSEQNSFAIDFFPLMNTSNANNNYILLNEDEVIGHIGVLYRNMKIGCESFDIPMLGGIAIKEEYRGKGHFKPFFNSVLSSITNSPFILLWSDKIDLYDSFGFSPCIEQYEYTGYIESDSPEFIKMKLNDLSDSEIIRLKNIYDESEELRYERSIDDWNELKGITSSDIYIKKNTNKEVTNYFFMNKGEDLTDIIYEYGDIKDIEEISTYGILWSPWEFEVENEDHKNLLYAALLKINNSESFQHFVQLYTNELITIESIEENSISFYFEKNKMTLNTSEFIQGLFGPNKFEELNLTKKILISGLDSI